MPSRISKTRRSARLQALGMTSASPSYPGRKKNGKIVNGRRARRQQLAQQRLTVRRPQSSVINFSHSCSFTRGRTLAARLDEHSRVIPQVSVLPNAGVGLKAKRDFSPGEIVVEVKGRLVVSFACADKLAAVALQGRKAEVMEDDSYVLYLKDVFSKKNRQVLLSYGLDPQNHTRYLNSSNGSGPPNLGVNVILDPSIVVARDGDLTEVREGQFREKHACVLGVATASIKAGDELLFPYEFSTDSSHLCTPAQVSQYTLKGVLKRIDPEGENVRSTYGYKHDRKSRTTLEMLPDIYGRSLFSAEFLECHQKLVEDPGNMEWQNRLVVLGNRKPATREATTQMLFSCYLYKYGVTEDKPLHRMQVHHLYRRLNSLNVDNPIRPGEAWADHDTYRYALRFRLLAPEDECTIMPLSYVAQEVRLGKIEPLVSFCHDWMLQKKGGTLVGNLNQWGVSRVVGDKVEEGRKWDKKSLLAFCQHHGITLPSAVPTYCPQDTQQMCATVWDRCQAGDTSAIWNVLRTHLRNKTPVNRVIKELRRHNVNLDISMNDDEKIDLTRLLLFIKQHGNRAQKSAWFKRIEQDIRKYSYTGNFGGVVLQAFHQLCDPELKKWLLLRIIDARLHSVTKEPSTMVRNINNQKLLNPDDPTRLWTSDSIYCWLQRNSSRMARIYLSNAGPRLKARLIDRWGRP
ncbi:SET domain-containing protein-lysine N-methyltransferase [Sansalvadorimonas verongulae]|uniref:SET domain-containing protein-lysine N-methyltransferase n=1 Tax=Sansalvadorimonas verongulae TaxID=2172824 RepID=UPI0012BD09C6|nr:SET domain-containing protein-lysine N-methyltransferase [Sansalvadorimonas verongulae]MTI12999.1 SET domain-containing protein-lysine N-methyltransferase [Sansalvadorimonas verongulae]